MSDELAQLSPSALDISQKLMPTSTAPARYSWEDVAAALSKARPAVALWGRVAYAGQEEFLADLRDAMESEIVREIRHKAISDAVAHYERWVPERPEFLRSLVQLAIVELVLQVGERCLACNGDGALREAFDDGSMKVTPQGCDLCQGVGHTGMPEDRRADLVGVSRQAWRNRWRDRYNRVIFQRALGYQKQLYDVLLDEKRG